MQSKLLQIFQHTEGYVSGTELSKRLACSRTAVWKQIRKLEQQGYRFEAMPRVGYRLLAEPKPFSVSAVYEHMTATGFGQRIKLLQETTSTQDVAKRWAAEGGREGDIVIAEAQTSGRGRQGKAWYSPPYTGIWMSLLLQPTVSVQAIPQLTLLTSVALCRSIRRMTGLEAGIKWPNDLLVEGKKISGILLESVAEDERLLYVVAGVGISVNVDPDDFPEDVKSKATSLKAETGSPVSRERLLADFLGEFEALYSSYLQSGFGAVRTLWETLSVTLGRSIKVNTGRDIVEGIAVGIEESGALRIQRTDGALQLVYAGELDR